MAEPTAQELAALFKWTICTKFKAMEETKAVEIEPCMCEGCNASRLKRWQKEQRVSCR